MKIPTRIALFAITVLFYACGAPDSDQAQESDSDPAKVVELPTVHYYGDSITADGALSPHDMLSMMEGHDSLEVKLRANINQTCKMKGCWMTLDMGDDQEMRVRFKDYGFFVPKEGAEGKEAIIEGVAFVDTITVEHLRHLAEDAGKSADEIAAINQPEVSVNFEARGVIISE